MSGIAIVGAAETERLGVIPDVSPLHLHTEAALAAIRDAGVESADIDGVASAGQSPVAVAHALGIVPEYLDGTAVGGSSFLHHVRHAVAAISQGLCNVVLITHGQSGRSKVGSPPSRPVHELEEEFERPYGVWSAATRFPLGLLRFMQETGLTHEQLARVAVVQRQWASRNPRAYKREPISVDDVLGSPLIAYPIRLLHCCLVTDGGGALVVTRVDESSVSSWQKPPVFVIGSGESSESPIISGMEDLTSSRAFRVSGARAFRVAGIDQADVDHLMIYDAFAHIPIYGLEDLGFVGRGEAGEFIEAGNTAPGGSLPLNTNGGGLSYTHTGMYGMFAIQESVRQVRGEAAAQVENVEISFALGVGGMFSAAATLVLSRRLP